MDFACHRSFCGKKLYPKQLTLLKLIYLETESMTQYDLDVIEGWRQGFKDRTSPHGVQPDIWDRVDYLKSHGYDHFPHVQMVMGRRASKGILGGIIGAERIGRLYSLGDWQRFYGLDPGTVGELTVVATSQNQAARRQFADIRRTVENCAYLNRSMIGNRWSEFAVQTPADRQRIEEMKLQGIPLDREYATLYAVAVSSTSTAGRGGTGFFIAFDEFAHMLMGSGSVKSGEEIYACLDPATRVLCSDLTWRPIGDLEVGDKIVGYDEYPDKKGHGGRRRLREAVVLGTRRQHGRAFRITFIDGKSVVCSPNHRWLRVNYIAKQGGHNGPRWTAIEPLHKPGKRTTRPLRVGDHIKFLVEPWETDDTRLGGWLAGIIDGEGSMQATAASRRISISQNEGPVLDAIREALKRFGFESYDHSRRFNKKTGKTNVQLEVNKLEQCIQMLGQFRPVRLLPDQKGLWEGRTISNAQNVKTIASIEEIEPQEVVDIETSTKTFIAEGLVSHNSFTPSADQFGKDKMIYVPSSPFSMVGMFYELYKQGSVTMEVYNEREGRLDRQTVTEQMLGADPEELLDAAVAEPEMLVAQGPSWMFYEDYERATTIPMSSRTARTFPAFKRPVQYPPYGEGPENKAMARLENRNPEKFKVERRGLFATVQDAYLDEAKVDAMFATPSWREPLVEQDRGKFSIAYRAHADPSKTNANFSFVIAHIEWAPCDACGWSPGKAPDVLGRSHTQPNTNHVCPEGGHVFPHVIVDKIKVWKPQDYPDHTVDYVAIGEELDGYLTRFPSISTMSFDQWNSQGFIAHQKRKFPHIRIAEKTFSQKENQDRFEKFKSALNLGLVHSYADTFGEEGRSLLELELKFLRTKNGKVDKQDFGPVTTKDVADSLMVTVVDLLHDHLDRWYKNLNRMAIGSTQVAGLKSGREMERLEIAGILPGSSAGGSRRGAMNRQRIEEMRHDRARGIRRDSAPIRTRGRR